MKAKKKGAPDSSSMARTEISARKLNELRGISDSEIFNPLTDERLAVLTFVHIHHTADVVTKAVERGLAARGLTVARYAILRMLSGRDPMPLSWVADRHFSQRSNITAVVDRLVRDGLVERLPDAVDRRVVRVQLTTLGAETVHSARAPHLEALAKIMSPLTSDEMHQLIDLLGKLSAPFEPGGVRLPSDL
jgi:MarR family 2-MHQ and catechol resistance regulon transcriptional repressor